MDEDAVGSGIALDDGEEGEGGIAGEAVRGALAGLVAELGVGAGTEGVDLQQRGGEEGLDIGTKISRSPLQSNSLQALPSRSAKRRQPLADVSTPGHGQGEGPVDSKLSRSDDADGNGRGRSERSERSSADG